MNEDLPWNYNITNWVWWDDVRAQSYPPIEIDQFWNPPSNMTKKILIDYLREIILACELFKKEQPEVFKDSPEEELMDSLKVLHDRYIDEI